jgi:hypothetical protein
VPELWDAVTGTNSQAPAARWAQRLMWRSLQGLVRLGRWLATTAWGTVAAALASAGFTHLMHLLGWLKGKVH